MPKINNTAAVQTLSEAMEALERLNKLLRQMESDGEPVGKIRTSVLCLWTDVFDIHADLRDRRWKIREVSPSGDSRVLPGYYATRTEALDGVLTLIREASIPEGYEVQVFQP